MEDVISAILSPEFFITAASLFFFAAVNRKIVKNKRKRVAEEDQSRTCSNTNEDGENETTIYITNSNKRRRIGETATTNTTIETRMKASASTNRTANMDSSTSPTTTALQMMENILDDDALRAILVRTNADDHETLRRTYKRFKDIMETSEFRRERGVLGYAQVTGVQLVDPFEQYKEYYTGMSDDWNSEEKDEDDRLTFSEWDDRYLDEYDDLGRKGDYGEHDIKLKIFVDHKEIQMESLEVRLLPRFWRPREAGFFEMCDSISQELQAMSVECFNNNGKPRLASLKAALQDNNHDTDFYRWPLLYISSFELPTEYRGMKCTVGPLILRTLLNDTLKDHRWSIAMYMPYYKGQFNTDDERQYNEARYIDGTLTDVQLREKKERLDRRNELTRIDMRQFFRAGFSQLADPSVILESSNFYVYTVPSNYYRNTEGPQEQIPMLTEREALEIEIVEPPPGPLEQTAKEKELFNLVLDKSTRHQEMIQRIDYYRKPPREVDECKAVFENMEEQMQDCSDILQRLQRVQEHKSQTDEYQSFFEFGKSTRVAY